jgi:hypothetical protein
MGRVAWIKSGKVINVIECENVDLIPDWGVIGIDENGQEIRKMDCDEYVVTDTGSKDDLYAVGIGFYRQ